MSRKISQRFHASILTRWLIPVLMVLGLLVLAAILVIALILPAG